MKYSFLTLLVLILGCMNVLATRTRSKLKSRMKAKLKARARSRNNKATVKAKTEKKDGPLLWDNLQDASSMASLQPLLSRGVDNINVNSQMVRHNNHIGESRKNIPVFLGGKVPLSENQKSLTFRTVGPSEDSTVNFKGKKYSHMFRSVNAHKINPGFYGKSRLTRL
jgi:hypothetical protein